MVTGTAGGTITTSVPTSSGRLLGSDSIATTSIATTSIAITSATITAGRESFSGSVSECGA
jgi:hypothetical protein